MLCCVVLGSRCKLVAVVGRTYDDDQVNRLLGVVLLRFEVLILIATFASTAKLVIQDCSSYATVG